MAATVAVLGELDLAKPTHRDLKAAVDQWPADVRAEWVRSDSARARAADAVDGLWVIPGSPYADDPAVVDAIERSWSTGLPFLGTCSGFQYAVLALARALTTLPVAHAELTPDAPDLTVAPLRCSLVGEVRPVTCVPGTRVASICGPDTFDGFHWCNYGIGDGVAEALAAAGVVIAAHAPDAGVEAIELPDHPFFVATLFQPQAGAADGAPPHPLVDAFLEAARRQSVAEAVAG
jgi:CTP synthase (UTP-ammonia lyase)